MGDTRPPPAPLNPLPPGAGAAGVPGQPPPLPKGKVRAGWLPTLVVIAGLLVLDFSPVATVVDQAVLGGFVTNVGTELFKQYVDKTAQSGVYHDPLSEDDALNAIRLLKLASNLTASPIDAGRASLALGEIQSRYLTQWTDALDSFQRAEALLPEKGAPKYQLARTHIELGQYENAAVKLREAVRIGIAADPLDNERHYVNCLAPFALAKLVFGPTSKGYVVESAKRLVTVQDGDTQLVSEGLGRAAVTCPASMQSTITLYNTLVVWKLPKGRGQGGKNGGKNRERKKKAQADKSNQQAKKTLQAFFDFVDRSDLKKLLGDWATVPSGAIVQLGMQVALDDKDDEVVEAYRATLNSQPLHPEVVVNPASLAPAGDMVKEQIDAAEGLSPRGIIGAPEYSGVLMAQPEDASNRQWHAGYTRLSLFDVLSGRLDALRAAADATCATQLPLIRSYVQFFDSHVNDITTMLTDNDAKPVLTSWTTHNQQLAGLCTEA